MNVVFTCGGTGGHINPAIAIANIWRERHPDSNILFICGDDPLEKKLVPQAGYEMVSLHTLGFMRVKAWWAVKYNMHAINHARKSIAKCKKLFREFKPDVIIGTGGYACFPALMAGAMMKIPTCVHESNAMPGLTTRILAPSVDKVLVCFSESIQHYKKSVAKKIEVVGMPVRREFVYTKKDDARAELQLDEKPLVISAFGSQGASEMNKLVVELFRLEKEAGFPFRHIHAAGNWAMEWMPNMVKEKGIDLAVDTDIQLVEYLYNMPTVMAASDVMISRAGASTCNEIAAAGKPSILIPSPNVSDNHQEKNARALSDRGGAVLLLEKDATPEKLLQLILDLLADKERYSNMRSVLQSISVPDSAERLCDIMEDLAKKNAR
jgi:UDP-N-acetylglucosamine--N-acetylmuramyl-(pentapeptide) pyrophosphoryl-undecaprenol N-acetylglucosamine transferase